MNINSEKIIENMDNSDYDYRGYIQKIMMMQVIQQIFCEMLIGQTNFLYTDMFSKLI